MLQYIIKRILLSILVLFGVSVILYFLVRLLPMDFVDQSFASQVGQGTISQEQMDALKQLYGLGDNSFAGIFGGYFRWLGKTLTGDLGFSYKYKEPVGDVIFRHMWVSFLIALVALMLQFAIAIPLGIRSARYQYGKFDYAVTTLTMVGIALPSYFLSALLMKVFSIELGWFPLQGLSSGGNLTGAEAFFDRLHHLVLPIVIVVILSVGSLMRYTRTNTLEVLNADYIRTARAKGLPERVVINKHAFRNTLIPLVTTTAGILPVLFSGSMIIEEVFAINGIGRMAYQALRVGDVPFIMGYNMFWAILVVIGTLLSDLAYGLVDPRVRINK
jgi:peptide/nickel transport system permease protein